MRILTFLSLYFLLLNYTYAQQNLLSNPSFEDYTTCPSSSNQLYLAYPWFDPTGASSDYFNKCANVTTFVSVPINLMGYQNAKHGSAYAGFVTYRSINDNFREYLSCKLPSSLEKDGLYCIRFYLSLADSCQYATNNIGIAFSTDTLKGSFFQPLNATLLNNYDDVIKNATDWIEVKFDYKALGGEQYITIGNFFDYTQTKVVLTNVNSSTYFDYAYYYIDDLSVNKCDYSFSIPNVFTPNNDQINDTWYVKISGNVKIFDCFIYDRWGIKVYESNMPYKDWDGRMTNGIRCSSGVYYYIIQINDKLISGYLMLLN
ncbi:MAG: gliding motility-associated C-terminal domain-containing protein [Bacteroidota bacterium]